MPDSRVSAGTRARAWIDDRFSLVVAVAVLLLVVGGILTAQAYLGTDTRTETREGPSWESVGSFEHSATVVDDAGPYDAGTVLRNRTAYFAEASPVLEGQFSYTYEASDGGSLDVETTLVRVTRSVDRTDDNATTLWRDETVVARDRVESLSPGETATVSFAWNASAARQEARAAAEELGVSTGDTALFLEARVDVSGTRNGRSVDRTRTYRLPVTFEGGVYRLDDPGRVTDGDTRTVTVSVPVSPDPVEAVGGPLALVVGVFGTLGLPLGRRLDWLTVDDAEREYLAYLSTRREFDEWITTVRDLDDETCEEHVPVDSLQGLVDLAIDTDARVLEAADSGRCQVRNDDVCYAYEPPPSPPALTEESSPADAGRTTLADGTSPAADRADATDDDPDADPTPADSEERAADDSVPDDPEEDSHTDGPDADGDPASDGDSEEDTDDAPPPDSGADADDASGSDDGR